MDEADVVRIVESSIAKKNESLLASVKSMLESCLTDLKRSHADTADSHLKEIQPAQWLADDQGQVESVVRQFHFSF